MTVHQGWLGNRGALQLLEHLRRLAELALLHDSVHRGPQAKTSRLVDPSHLLM